MKDFLPTVPTEALSTPQKRALWVSEQLEALYPAPPNGFLTHSNPFTLLVAVLLSAQCTDKRVNLVTPALFALADTPQKMSFLSASRIEELIRPCGLAPKKSKAIFELSHQLLERHEGKVPASFEALEALSGVGHKTASVVMNQAFGIPSFPVDTHIARLAQRWGLSAHSNVVKIEADLKSLYPKDTWGKKHLQFILFGRELCTARGCHGKECPLCCILEGFKPFFPVQG